MALSIFPFLMILLVFSCKGLSLSDNLVRLYASNLGLENRLPVQIVSSFSRVDFKAKIMHVSE